MSYDPDNLWTEAEDDAMRVFYPRHGLGWEGWQEVLPNRTKRSIGTRAIRLGLAEPRPRQAKPKRRRGNETGDDRHRKYGTATEPDPNERYILACLKAGLTPDEIDRKMHWWPRTTIRILTERWARNNEQDVRGND